MLHTASNRRFSGLYRACNILSVGLLISTLSGCRGTQQIYHPVLLAGTPGTPSAVWETPEGKPYFGFVEFDDQGERWDSSIRASKAGELPTTQLQTVTRAIKRAGGRSGNKPFYLIVFAHGWNNNGSPKNDSLLEFHQRILQLRRLHELDGAEVFGVFLAWRGDAPGRPFNFYHRSEAGHRVGERIAGTLFDLITAARQASSRSKVALIGHSFGSHLIEGGILPVLQADVARAVPNDRRIPLAADLILLVNPARSSLYSKPFIDQLRDSQVKVDCGDVVSHHELPLIVTITSEGDTATGKIFPIGYSVGRRISLFNTSVSGLYRKSTNDPAPQEFSHKHTSGWNKVLHSHIVTKEPYSPAGRDPKIASAPSVSDSLPEEYRAIDRMIRANYRPWQPNGTILVHGLKQNYRITPAPPAPGRTERYNDTPYWIMQVPKDIVANHSDVWNSEYVALVTALLYLPVDEPQQADVGHRAAAESPSDDFSNQKLMLRSKP
jgi:hypothetical protein